LLGIGLAVGIPTAIGMGRFVASQLYGIKANDPTIAAASMITMIIVATLAGLIPAQRASRIDPILALRYE
jgi:ABC-type antimicrobial peptide transport system permease subunit